VEFDFKWTNFSENIRNSLCQFMTTIYNSNDGDLFLLVVVLINVMSDPIDFFVYLIVIENKRAV